ncbi:hypothetical protein LTR86_001158 [Recurvomyces mirabilis]|nr:hypothetical protein LTR86_001158 [Recurvomyces mirabilis]
MVSDKHSNDLADETDGLLAIEVDTDDYADAAAEDTPSVSRTYQSEADFQAQRLAYTAETRHCGSNTYDDLMRAVPVLRAHRGALETGPTHDDPVRLSKKDGQLLGYTVGEFYYDRKYSQAIDLCERVERRCVADNRLHSSLQKWKLQCHRRMRGINAVGQNDASAIVNG